MKQFKILLVLFLVSFQTVFCELPHLLSYYEEDFNDCDPLKAFIEFQHRRLGKDYDYNPYVPIEIWDELKPLFLPYYHPVRQKLDKIFKKSRVTLTRETFSDAGFELNSPKTEGNLLVGKHPKLEGYLIKAYLDTQHVCEFDNYAKRIIGAKAIKKSIFRHKYHQFFRVPKKWIYPLPVSPGIPNDPKFHRKNFILVVEDMYILNHHENGKYFLNRVTPEMLDALFDILTELGLLDSVHRGNIPFDIEGKMNFIDTEHHHIWPVPYHCLLRVLSPEMQHYWQNLIDHGGKIY